MKIRVTKTEHTLLLSALASTHEEWGYIIDEQHDDYEPNDIRRLKRNRTRLGRLIEKLGKEGK